MRRILAVGLVLLVPAVALAQTKQADRTVPIRAVQTDRRALPALKLPNVSLEVRRLQTATRNTLQKQLVASRNVIRFWEGKHQWVLAKRHEKCWEVPWQRSCTIGRASYRLHLALAAKAQERLEREIPLILDWRTAVHWVQRIYPGTEQWMVSISDREGGWGQWVWYGGRTWSGYHIGDDFLGADTVGGWMQFRYSTFAPYWRGAQKDLVREQASHRCERCGHPYLKGNPLNSPRSEWTPCDEHCTHVGPMRTWTHPPGMESMPGSVFNPVEGIVAGDLIGTHDRVDAQWRILTVHHLNGIKHDCRWWNLAALCQRCHLAIQGRVVMERVWPWEHTEWFKPHAAGWYAAAYLGEDLSREETMARLDELLDLEREDKEHRFGEYVPGQ